MGAKFAVTCSSPFHRRGHSCKFLVRSGANLPLSFLNTARFGKAKPERERGSKPGNLATALRRFSDFVSKGIVPGDLRDEVDGKLNR